MPNAKYQMIPPGVDPTDETYIPDTPSLSGCLLKIGIVVGIIMAVLWFISNQAVKASPATPAATQAPSSTPAPTNTPGPTATPVVMIITATPLAGTPTAKPYTATFTPTITATHTATITPTFTGTPFVSSLWVSLSALWPKRDGLTVSGVSWRSVVDKGLVCPESWPIGAVVLLDTQQEYLCVDRYKTAKCKDNVCTALLFTQNKVDAAPRKAIIKK